MGSHSQISVTCRLVRLSCAQESLPDMRWLNPLPPWKGPGPVRLLFLVSLCSLILGALSETGHELIGAGGCRGDGWSEGSWPVTAGKQSRESCSALCQVQEGCTSFSLSKSEDCFLFGHDDITAVKSLGGECYKIIKSADGNAEDNEQPSPAPIDRRAGHIPQSPAPPCRPPPPTAPTYPTNDNQYYSDVDENLNYKTLFEREKQEKELYGAKLAEMEQQHQALESNLKKFLDLKKEMRNFQREAEESDRVVNDFIKAVVPDFTNPAKKRSNKDEEDEEERKSKMTKSQGKPPLPSNLVYRANPVQTDPDLPSTPSPSALPMPTVQYEWDDAFTSPTPIGRYSYSTTSRSSSRLDELKLNLVFDVNSKQLPTKLQLEIKDKKGRVVFRKRQNLYYVKVQERLSTLDAEDDYIMTVTSICGPSTTTEEVPIHNKYYSHPETEETEPFTISESMTIPVLETCRSPSEASWTSGFDERSIDSIFDTPLKNMEATYDEIRREVSETPLPDLEEIVEVDFAPAIAKAEVIPALSNHEIEPEVVVLEKKNPFLLLKKPIIPEVLYRWQRGFRRGPGSQYRKVPILKIQFKYEETEALLPSELDISCAGDFKRVIVSQKVATAESVAAEGQSVTLSVISKDRTGQDALTAPPFILSPDIIEDSHIGEWHITQPALTIDLY